MMKPAEAVGSVPQSGVNPQSRQAPVPAAPQPAELAAPVASAAHGELSPEDIEAFRSDPEIIEAVSMFLGKQVTLEAVPENFLIQISGMVQKLGVQGAVQQAQQNMPPELQQQLRQAAQ